MNRLPIPEDIEYLSQQAYGTLPHGRIIYIDPHWFDLEILALWIQINPSNPLTGLQLSEYDLWNIITKYNNYLDSEGAILTETPKRFNYNENQFVRITNELNMSINNNTNLPWEITNLIKNIRTRQNAQLPQAIRWLINGNVPTNCIGNFEVGLRYIYIDSSNGLIGRTEPFIQTINLIPRFGENGLEMSLTRYIFYKDLNPELPIEQFPRPLEVNNLIPGIRYFGLCQNDTLLCKLMPFISLTSNNSNPKFGNNISSAIFSRNNHYFYDEQELNNIGIHNIG